MNFSKKVMSLLSDSLENYPDIFLVDFKVSNDNAIKGGNIIVSANKNIHKKFLRILKPVSK